MGYLDFIFNLSLLVALSVVSGFLDKRWPRETRHGQLLQGALFGAVIVLGMLRPLVLGPGLIFDGRAEKDHRSARGDQPRLCGKGAENGAVEEED